MKRATLAVVGLALGTAVLFEALTLAATQDKVIRAVSPWQDDPYDVFVSFAQFAVPMLALAIALRLAVWRAPGGPDREQQTIRATGGLIALIAAVLAFEWAAVTAGAHAPAWNRWTTALITGLAATSALTVAVAVALWRLRSPRGTAHGWRHDWLGDAALVGRRIPVLRRWATPGVVERIREHATAVFVAASLLAAAGAIGAQAVGERWTDPLLIAWAVAVWAATSYAFCVVANASAGFIARPPRTRGRRVVEASVVAGAVALTLMTAFRDPVWTAFAGRPVPSVAVLVGLTVGAGLAASAIAAVVLGARLNGGAR